MLCTILPSCSDFATLWEIDRSCQVLDRATHHRMLDQNSLNLHFILIVVAIHTTRDPRPRIASLLRLADVLIRPEHALFVRRSLGLFDNTRAG